MAVTFHKVEDAVVILRSKGVFKQADVYHRNGHLYAKHGSGYIRLKKDGTSIPSLMVDEMELNYTPKVGDFGYLLHQTG